MKTINFLFAVIGGGAFAVIINDFLPDYQINIEYLNWFSLIIFPVISVFCLWIAELIGKKLLFVFQVAKFVLVGILATLIDLKFFEILILAFAGTSNIILGLSKGISFFIATVAKYSGNKFWAFEKKERGAMAKEFIQFFLITLLGLGVDVGVFLCLVKTIGPQFGVIFAAWVKISVIVAALVAAIWNFSGYKFIVFKK